jgi:hypothetical protein
VGTNLPVLPRSVEPGDVTSRLKVQGEIFNEVRLTGLDIEVCQVGVGNTFLWKNLKVDKTRGTL